MRRWSAIIASTASLLVLLVPGIASADVNDFAVTSFSADETLTRADPQGELRIIEHIDVDFNDYNHGILRAIPQSYHGHTLKLHINKVSSGSSAPAQYTTSSSSGNEVLKIGDPNRTVTGPQAYTIDYTVRNVIGFTKGDDELYWDVNGDQWDQQFGTVTTVLHLPSGLQLTNTPPQCFTGSFGSTAANCLVIGANRAITITAPGGLLANQTLTYRVYFQKGYFAPMTFWETFGDYAAPILEVAVPIVLAFGIAFSRWWRLGRDPKGRGTIVPEYAAPEGISPLDAGTIADFKTDNRDITATFIDLARRGYLRIIENRKDRKILKDQVSYTLELRKSDWSACTPFETRLLMDTFSGSIVGLTADLSDLSHKLYKTAKDIRNDLGGNLALRGYFRKNPTRYIGVSSGIIVVVLVGGNIVGPALVGAHLLPLAFGVGIGAAIWLVFEHFMPARTELGVAAKEALLGLKMYMETAEKDRLEKLEGPNAAYAAGAGQPQRTVELFEKLLPYAIVLKVESQWAAKFNDIYKSAPDWYVGNWTAFNAGYLAGSLSSGFASAINTGFTAPSSSGAGGGGFAGGGGGGGGGGGW